MKVVLAGAYGNLGSEILREHLKEDSFQSELGGAK